MTGKFAFYKQIYYNASLSLMLYMMKVSRLNPNRKMLSRGPLYLAANAGIAGMVANSFYRRVLHVTQGLFTSSLPMAVLPFVTTAALYTATVTTPLLSGNFTMSCVNVARVFIH